MSTFHIAQTSVTPLLNSNTIFKYATSSNGLLVMGCLVALGAIALFGQGRKTKVATGHLAGSAERNAARTQAIDQISKGQKNSVGLYIGRPTLIGKPPLYLPDAQRGIAVCGGPGSGKTFSVIDPALRSVIDQGFPLILYDFKYPTQTERIAGYAKSQGYDVRVFAPGFPESDTCNPLDFLEDQMDSLMARQMAEVLNKNFSTGSINKSEDPFFTQAGDQLTEAIFMLAKGTEYPDIMMCQALLSMDNLAERIQAKADAEQLNTWVYSSFGQLLSVAESEKTVASIVATANSNFTRFIKQDLLGAFCGETTIPLDLHGRQLLIFGMNRERRDVVSPLLATVLHMIITRNVVQKRDKPLVVSLDELPTLYLPSLVQWLNENREDGLVCLLGFQNMAQLEKTYGKELSRAILGGCATKAIFNPQEYESAQMFSEFLGEEEIQTKQKSKGTSAGKGNTNVSDQDKTRKLFEPSRFLKLPTGQCILLNPGYRNKQESGVPLHQKISLPRGEIRLVEKSQSLWEQTRKRLKHDRVNRQKISEKDLIQRYKFAEKFFPRNPNGNSSNKAKKPIKQDKDKVIANTRKNQK
jgi:type IV secretory pathway TraG/TraD family ATPase VirD4